MEVDSMKILLYNKFRDLGIIIYHPSAFYGEGINRILGAYLTMFGNLEGLRFKE